MIIRHHSLEAYYLNRRLELLQRLDAFAEQAAYEEDFDENNLAPALDILNREYADVMDPENLCKTIRSIYPDHLFGMESRRASKRKGFH